MMCEPVTDLDVVYLLVTHHLKEKVLLDEIAWGIKYSLRRDQDVNAQNKDCSDIRSAEQSKQSYSCPI